MRSLLPSGHPKASEVVQAAEVLATMLGQSIGANKAQEAVDEALRALGYGPQLTREQALAVLERISNQDGIVGIAARFAKSRVHLHWDTGLL